MYKYDELMWISAHPEAFRFNTEQARVLKREIEHWSCLPASERKQKARKLYDRFQAMFADNPLCERAGLVTDRVYDHYSLNPSNYSRPKRRRFQPSQRMSAEPCLWPGDITGTSAQAYSWPEMQPTVSAGKRQFTEQDASKACKYFQEDAKDAVNCLQIAVKDIISKTEDHYSSVLRSKAGKFYSPSTMRSVWCILFLYAFAVLSASTVSAVSTGWLTVSSVWSIGKPLYVRAACLAAMAGVIIGQRKILIPSIPKGFYRSWFCRRFRRWRKHVNAAAKKTNILSAEITKSSRAFSALMTQTQYKNVDKSYQPYRIDPTRQYLRETKKQSRIGAAVFPVQLWKHYNLQGERGLGGGMLFLVLILIFISLGLRWQCFGI